MKKNYYFIISSFYGNFCDVRTLKLKLKTEQINGFCLQPIFILAPELKYKPDFIIFNKYNTMKLQNEKGGR